MVLWVCCVTVYTGIKFTQGGVNMDHRTRRKGVGGVMLLRGVSWGPGGAEWPDIPTGRYGLPPQAGSWRLPLFYRPPVTHPPSKVTRKLT